MFLTALMKNCRSNMDRLEIEACLESMEILVDTREQPGARATKRYNAFGCPYKRHTLSYGDYTYNFTLPNGKLLFEPFTTAEGDCVIERKMNLEELSGCLCQQRDRFRREFEKARDHGAKIYLLVEDGSWENVINGRYKTKFNPNAYFATLTAWMARYDISLIFCKKETSGKLIKQILYRELKERLENGFYD